MKGLFNLMPKNTFKKFARSNWMRAVQERITAEREGKRFTTPTVLSILPQPVESCLPGFSSRDEFCKFDLVDMTVFGNILEEDITYNSLANIFKQYSILDNADAIWTSVQDKLFEELPNTGVQTNVVFSGTLPTMNFFQFDEDPKVKTKAGSYVMPTSEKNVYGDGVVISTSSLIAGLKWADDNFRLVDNAKPVNIIEVCSTKNRRPDIFTPGTKTVNANAYFGIDCDCAGTRLLPRDGKRCGHTTMLNDAKVVSFLLRSAVDGVASVESADTQKFAAKTEEQLQDYENRCKLLNDN